MDWRLPVMWLGIAACGRHPQRARADFEATAFVAGRYAVLIERNMSGAHARQHVTHRSFASLVLDLGGDGKATACLGWRHVQTVDEPRQDRRFSLQQGFAGTHSLHDGRVDVALHADSSVCPEVRKDQAPTQQRTMNLRCVLARPRGHAALRAPVLLCEWREADSFTRYDFAADGLAPDRWLLLGSGNGVRARVTGKAISTDGAPVKVVAETAAAPITFDAWDRALPAPENTFDP